MHRQNQPSLVCDKCAWTFGTTFQVPNDALANSTLGGNTGNSFELEVNHLCSEDV